MSEASKPYVHKPIDAMETIWRGSYTRARGELDVTAFGLGVMQLPPDYDRIPPHTHSFDGQEEVYLPLAGSGQIVIGDEAVAIDPQIAVRVGPTAGRRITSGPDGLRVLIVGGTPGQAYEPFEPLELGAPEPEPAELPGIKAHADAAAPRDDADFAATQFSAMEHVYDNSKGVTLRSLRRELGVTAFGIAVIDIEPTGDENPYPLHDHEKDGQTEVYVVQRGSGTLLVDDETVDVRAGEMIAVPPEISRQWSAGPDGLRLVAIGAPTGRAYEPRP